MIEKEKWKPKNMTLEENAELIIHSQSNILVTAGPGAGKTELLAQKACYLFETNTCEYPQKILAISFKRDAAKTLKERIIKRCGDNYGERFDSMTYEAFFKLLLDRFRNVLPKEYSLNKDYVIKEINYRYKEARQLIDSSSNDIFSFDSLQCIEDNTLETDIVCKDRISTKLSDPKKNHVKEFVWKTLLENNRVTFSMIPRLVELIIEKNPLIKQILNLTYSYLFLDEFQDTTNLQYELVKDIFLDSDCIVTAVGDDKQSIMRWAGAKPNIFNDFMTDFKSRKVILKFNYRSNPELIKIQKAIASLITNDNIEIQSKKEITNKDVCRLYIFENEYIEAKKITKKILGLLKEGVDYRDICILVRQKCDNYAKLIVSELKKNNVLARIEEQYQNILAEPITELIIAYLKLLVKEHDINSYILLRNYFRQTLNVDCDEDSVLTNSITLLKQNYDDNPSLAKLIDNIINCINYEKLCRLNRQYLDKEYFDSIIRTITNNLETYLKSNISLKSAIEEFEGVNTIPIMTIHKSKGLEFNTIILIGCEDDAFWKYEENSLEENCTLFVAFSRAKERVIITFSKKRKNNYGRLVDQKISHLQPFFEKLKMAGVKIYDGNSI